MDFSWYLVPCFSQSVTWDVWGKLYVETHDCHLLPNVSLERLHLQLPGLSTVEEEWNLVLWTEGSSSLNSIMGEGCWVRLRQVWEQGLRLGTNTLVPGLVARAVFSKLFSAEP